VREALRLRGFGFKFETDYRAQLRQDAVVIADSGLDPESLDDIEETPDASLET